ncbi:hypothetical protein [Mycolicibacterium hodleri]|uniref:Uncharacterized protein n=1 Tax=Mycolicibacterium hodleri TaxID=49897 RepID=A0A502ECV8_9MYCO|nr:hypothetical protein [Mycolicibacterium hodleri]TPG34221.1 hypothetical protein EAH80_11525 [Mycolicibacterium hodleri]
MKGFVFRALVIVVVAIAALATFGSGISAAKDPYVDQTYAYAAGKISERGGVPVVATIVGDQLSTDDCIVTSWRKATYASTDNFDHGKDYLFALNCSAKLASGSPGNSIMSPEGQAQKKIEDRAAAYNAKPSRCESSLESCQKFCEKNAGLCSKEVMALF